MGVGLSLNADTFYTSPFFAMKTLFAILSLATIGLGAVVRDSTDTFDPYAFKLHTVTCPAVERVKNINTTLQIGALLCLSCFETGQRSDVERCF